MKDNYTKITYQSEPIGKEKIILYLTTFDIEAFEKDQSLEKIPTKTEAKIVQFEKNKLEDVNILQEINNYYEDYINKTYKKQLEEMASYIETLRKIKIVPQWNAKNITNSDDVHCNIVEGNITNCDNVYCNEIKGNVVNCDKIIYKK